MLELESGLGVLKDKLLNFRFSRTHQTCGCGWGLCGTNCRNSDSRVRTERVWLGLREVVGIGVLAIQIAELQVIGYATKPVVGVDVSY